MTDTSASISAADEVAKIESEAAMLRLEAVQRSCRLGEDVAVGVTDEAASRDASATLAAVTGHIERLQTLVRESAVLSHDFELRLAEVGLDLETARRRLRRALDAANVTTDVS